ncbi:MAG: hypothetical protein KZQ95_11595 [Candidatus Thiodiazotropha sp. (ex Epidulcina cf. delphinae)]|nr:hypothetical protein [Candidatus Thiodiazotropha sp. (ex Epidulcina cf. delphinae)]
MSHFWGCFSILPVRRTCGQDIVAPVIGDGHAVVGVVVVAVGLDPVAGLIVVVDDVERLLEVDAGKGYWLQQAGFEVNPR